MAENSKIFLTQAEFSRRRGVSKKTVTQWKGNGLLVLGNDGRVDIEATEWNLDQRPAKYRGGVAHRPTRSLPEREQPAKPTKPAPTARDTKPKTPVASADDEPGDDELEFDPDNPNLSLPEAVRRKENFLGLQRKQAVEKEAGQLVERAVAEALFFATARDLRDAWLSWPARIAVVMADELQIDARALTTVLTAHVQQHLAELGEPECQL